MNAEIIKQAAEKEIACHPDQKNIRFKIDDTIFWIKRKYSNKRNRLIKQPPETEFLFEVARIAIAAKAIRARSANRSTHIRIHGHP